MRIELPNRTPWAHILTIKRKLHVYSRYESHIECYYGPGTNPRVFSAVR
jgi:hypothetical protein